MKNKDIPSEQTKVQPQYNKILAIYMLSITTIVLSYGFYLAQVHLA